MKKLISLLLVAAVIFSLGACSGKNNEETDGNTPVSTEPYSLKIVRDKKFYKEFKTEDGKVTYVIDAVMPEVFGCNEAVCDSVNSVFETIISEAEMLAKVNIEHAANYMESFGTDKPWTRKITYEIKFCNAKYLCILLTDDAPLTADPEIVARTFNLETGNIVSLSELETDGVQGLDPETKEAIKFDIISQAENLAGAPLTEEQMKKLEKAFDFSNFWFNEFQFAVVVPMVLIDDAFYGKGHIECRYFLADYNMQIAE